MGTVVYEVPVNFEAPQVDPPPPPENLSARASINETPFRDIIRVSSDRVLSLTGTSRKGPSCEEDENSMFMDCLNRCAHVVNRFVIEESDEYIRIQQLFYKNHCFTVFSAILRPNVSQVSDARADVLEAHQP